MPKGVEHAPIHQKGWVHYQVSSSVMPKGVEHAGRHRRLPGPGVSSSVMPKGVEHKVVELDQSGPEWCRVQ